MEGYTITNIGRVRRTNQDYSFCSCKSVGKLENLFVVADGMGGHNAGDFASSFTVNEIVSQIYSDSFDENPIRILRSAITEANHSLYLKSIEEVELAGTGTTLVCATVSEGVLYAANVGDSRLYLYHDGLKQVTVDHSYVEELVRLGKMERNSPEYNKHKHVITRAIGTEPEVEIDFFEEKVRPGDIVLMCSDGLTGMVSDGEIEEILSNEKFSLKDKVTRLVELANDNGGVDNIAILLTQIS